MEHEIRVGQSVTSHKVLAYNDSAVAPELNYLLTTPQLVETIIEASAQMLDHLVPVDYITIDTHLNLSHDHPTLVMDKVRVTTELVVKKVEANKVTLAVKCADEIGVIMQVEYERAIVNKEKLRDNTYKRLSNTL